MADSPISPTTKSPGSASSPSSSNHLFSRFRLTNPFASSATATTDGNSRRKSSTALPGATSPDSPTFKMSSTNGGNKSGNGSRLPWRKDSVPVHPITPPATAASHSSNNASTTNLPLMTEDISSSATAGAEVGGVGGGGGFSRTVKRTASAGSLGKMLGDRFGANKGQSTWQKARKRFSAGSSADDEDVSRGSNSRPASSASGRLSRSNAMHGRGRKSSWRGSWGSSAASASTDKNNNNNSHISFSNTDVTDGAVANPDAGGPHKGFRRRKTSTTLHGLVGGKGRGLGLGSSALAMTPAGSAEDGGEDRPQRPNTRDGVFTNSIAADAGGTTAAVALSDNDGRTPARKKSSSVSNAADSLARRIKIHRLKRSSSLDAKLFLGGSNGESSNNNGSNANNSSSTTGGRPRSKSESASALLATPAKLIKYRPFLSIASGGGSKGSGSNNHSTSIANNAHPNASTTALRRPSRTPSSESGFDLSVSGIETHGLLSSSPSGGGGLEPSSTAGATSSLSGPTLLLPDTDSDEHHLQADAAAAAATTATTAASSSAESSRSRSSWSRLSLRIKRSRSNASGVADSAAGSRAPTLPELPPSENYLLGEFSIPEYEHVEGADGEIEWVEKGTGRVVQTIGKQTGTRRQDADAIRRVVENRRKIVVASDRAEEEGEGRPSRSGAADDGEQAKRTEIWVEEVKREQAADPAEAKAGAELRKEVASEAVAKDVESGASVREVDGRPSGSAGDGVPVIRSPSPRSLTPKPTPAQLAAAHEITARGRAMLVQPGKRHDRIIPSQGSSVYSTQDTSPLTPPTSSGTPIPQDNDYAKDIETEIVDDRWVDYGPLNEVRLL